MSTPEIAAPVLSPEDPTMARRGSPSAPTLGSEIKVFWSHRNPWIIAAALVGAAVYRATLGGWGWWDLGIVGIQLAAQPFVEWVIHVYVLHAKPARVLGRNYDSIAAKKHREHHADPRRIEWIFVPLPTLIQLFTIMLVLFFLVTPTTALAMTALASGLAILLTYEWTHFLIHSRYQPKSRPYRYMWRAHRLHHFKNEHYWFGVTMHAADHVLKTFPEKDEVETSKTCRTLGMERTVS